MMKIFIISCFILLAFQINFPVNIEMIQKIKQKASWVPEEISTSKFKDWSVERIKSILGLTKHMYRDEDGNLYATEQSKDRTCPLNISIPDQFDSRIARPNCTGPVRDQGNCGSCWAFGAAESFSDSLCIAKNNSNYMELSPQSLVSCNILNYGCDGGYLDTAWNHLSFLGTVSDTCFPYTSGDEGQVPRCRLLFCVNKTERLTRYRCKLFSVVNLGNDTNCMRSWIYANGPLEVGFYVYEDFLNYKSGVYYHVSGELLGAHAVKAIGWGVDPTTGFKYWLLQNSWGTSWGMNGYFLFKEGDSYIDSEAYSCTPK